MRQLLCVGEVIDGQLSIFSTPLLIEEPPPPPPPKEPPIDMVCFAGVWMCPEDMRWELHAQNLARDISRRAPFNNTGW